MSQEFRSTNARALVGNVREGVKCPACQAPFPQRIQLMCSHEVPADATFMVTITCPSGCQVLPLQLEWERE